MSGGTASLSVAGSHGNLVTRLLAALVLGPAVLGAVYLGGWVFAIGATAASALGLHEWLGLIGLKGRDRLQIAGHVCLAAVTPVVFLIGLAEGLTLLGVWTVAVLAAALAGGYRHFLLVGLGIPYVGVPMAAMVWLRGQPEIGYGLVMWLFLVVWATDIGGYFVGRAIGGPKLAPRISPKKTWAGLAGAVAAAAAAGMAVAIAFRFPEPALAAVLAGLLAVVAQAGDLLESAVKRRFDVKDSGTLIPGHGGVLDRIDGLLAATPALAVVYVIFDGTAWS